METLGDVYAAIDEIAEGTEYCDANSKAVTDGTKMTIHGGVVSGSS